MESTAVSRVRLKATGTSVGEVLERGMLRCFWSFCIDTYIVYTYFVG